MIHECELIGETPPPIALLPHVPSRQQIESLAAAIARCPKREFPVRHIFLDDNTVYGREITIPDDSVLVGKVHRYKHFNILVKGEITVWTERGMKRLRAPFAFVSYPGTMRAGWTHADTIWTTFHLNPTHCTDPAKLEELLVEPPSDELIKLVKEQPSCLLQS